MGSYSIEMVILTLYYRHYIKLESIKRYATYNIFVGLKRFNECGGNIVHSEDDLSDASLSQGLDLVTQDGLVTEEHKWLGNREGKGSETGAVASDKDKSLHLYKSLLDLFI
jgi:hypothetical protein